MATATTDFAFTACPWCGLKSYHPKDIEHGFCAACDQFHEELRLKQALFLTPLTRENGYLALRPLEKKPGHWGGLAPKLFTTAIITGRFGDADTYEDCWCYMNAESALAALTLWHGEGEPRGWYRHPPSGRRRDPETGLEEIRH